MKFMGQLCLFKYATSLPDRGEETQFCKCNAAIIDHFCISQGQLDFPEETTPKSSVGQNEKRLFLALMYTHERSAEGLGSSPALRAVMSLDLPGKRELWKALLQLGSDTCHFCSFTVPELVTWPHLTARQAHLSMECSRQEYWRGQPFPSPEDLPNPGIEPESPALQVDPLPSEPPGKPEHHCQEVQFYQASRRCDVETAGKHLLMAFTISLTNGVFVLIDFTFWKSFSFTSELRRGNYTDFLYIPCPSTYTTSPIPMSIPHQRGTFVIIDETTLICGYQAQSIYLRIHL